MIATEEIEEQALGLWDVTEEDYHTDTRHVSNSMLKVFSESVPRYHQTYITREIEREESDALRIGKAFHLMVLEPMRGLDLIVRAPKVDRRTKLGRETWDVFEAENDGKLIVSQEEYDQLTAMRDGILTNPTARNLIQSEGMRERPIRWQHSETGLWCKAKPDLMTFDFFVDLKTIDSLANWTKHVANFGYHRQQSFYQSGDRAITEHFRHRNPPKEFVFVVVEKQAPFEAAAFTLDESTVMQGQAENEAALIELAERIRTKNWKSRYYGRIQETSLPRWALKGA